jgi:hypothetical protein
MCPWMDLKVHHDVPMNGPKGPSCVWSKAPIGCKKYPAVAGYFMKMEQSSTKEVWKGNLFTWKREGLCSLKLWMVVKGQGDCPWNECHYCLKRRSLCLVNDGPFRATIFYARWTNMALLNLSCPENKVAKWLKVEHSYRSLIILGFIGCKRLLSQNGWVFKKYHLSCPWPFNGHPFRNWTSIK